MTLSVEKGTFSYTSGGRPVLKDIDFSVGPGDMLAILGPNGAGKTTLLRCIMGFLRWSGGRSALDGKDIRAFSQRELWRSIAYVPQARGVAPGSTALEMVLLGRGSRVGAFSRPGEGDVQAAREAMASLHIEHLEKKRCSEMSGGELQMVLIARALAAQPRILILDEPESNLDFKNQLLVLGAMSQLTAAGMTCVFNTHYPAHALWRAGKALLLSKEGCSLFGETHTVVTEQNIEAAFGVKAVIGQVETPATILRDVIPLEICPPGGPLSGKEACGERTLAVLAIIARDFEVSQRINELLHEASPYIVGRMGMPYRSAGVFIINVTVDAPLSVVEALSARLALLPGVSVKATHARGALPKKEA